MDHLEGILRLVDKEFGEMEQNGKFRNKEDIEIAYKLIDIAKDVYEVWDCEAKTQGGYSENGYSMNNGMPRNTMGQYTNRGMRYSSANDTRNAYINSLYDAMRKAPDESIREHIRSMIHEAEQMM